MLDVDEVKNVIEAVLLVSTEPLSVDALYKLFEPGELPDEDGRKFVREAFDALSADLEGRGVELKRVASGYRLQARQ